MSMPKGLKIVGIVLVVVVVLIIAAIGALYIMFPPAKLKALALPQVEKILGRKTEVGSIGITIFPNLGVRIKDLAIANTSRPGFDNAVSFVKLEEFTLSVKVMPLLKKQVQISKIIIRKPEILVETDTSGSFNFNDLAVLAKDTTKKEEAPKKTGGPMLPIPLTLEQFTIANGTIVYDDKKGKMKLELGSINQTVAFNIDKALKDVKTNGKLVISDISYQSKNIKKPLSGLTITLSHDLLVDVVAGNLTIKDLRASLQKIYVGVTGTVTNFNETPVLDLNVKTEKINLADLIAEIPVSLYADITKMKASGILEAGLTIKGELPEKGLPQIDGHALLENVFMQYAGLPKAINSVNADIGFTANSLNIAAMNLKLGDDPVSIKGTVNDFAKPIIDLELLANVNLGNLKDVVPLPKDNALSGSIKADIRAKGPADAANPQNLDLAGKIELFKVTATTPAITKPVTADGVVMLTSKAISPDIRAVIGSSTLNLKAQLDNYLTLALPNPAIKQPRPKITFTLSSPYLNTNEFLRKAEKAGQKPVAKGAATAKAAPMPLLAGPIPGIDLAGSITTKKLLYEDVELDDINMKVTQANDVMDMPVTARLLGGTFSHVFRLDMRNFNNLVIHSVLAIDNVDATRLINSFKGMIPETVPLAKQSKNLDKYLFGKISVKSDLTANGATTEDLMMNAAGVVNTAVKNGRIAKGPIIDKVAGALEKFYPIKDVAFDDMTIKARIKDGRVYFDDSVKIMSRAGGDWKFTGDIGFDASMGLGIANRLPPVISSRILAVQNTGKNALKDLLGNSQLGGAAAGLIDNAGIPSDKEGRVTLLLGMDGAVSSPKVSFRGFGGGTKAQTPQQSLKQQVQQNLEQKKQELEQQAQKKIEEQAKTVEKKIEQKTGVNTNELKKAAQKQLKKLF